MENVLRFTTRTWTAALALTAFAGGCGPTQKPGPGPGPGPGPAEAGPPKDPRETHLGELRQLTFGGENAEAYWSWDGTELIMQSTRPPYRCDQIFTIPALAAGEPRLVSTGTGRTTCSFFYPGDQRVLFASTHLAGADCPPVPDHSQGYVWPLYDTYDIFTARPDGSELAQLTTEPGYDAEATICGKDGSVIFTSTRDGDLELYRMDADGQNVRRLTNTPGYDGGAFFSPDCSQIVWRASRPADEAALADYQRLLAKGLVRPSKLELWIANADGTEARQITYLDSAAFAPYFHPSGKRLLFSTNYGDPKGREFDIWAINTDGTGLERITYTPGFDGFPMFSPDGKHLAFSSNRNQKQEGDTDVYVAEWIDAPAPVANAAPDRVMASVRWLADDARGGRGIGSDGLTASGEWLEQQFKALGLSPAGDDGGYRHHLEVVVGITAAETTALELDGKPVAREAFTPLGFSASGEVAGAVVAVGHGITAPELGVDDYKKLNVKGKIVVVKRFTPEGGKFEDEKLQRRYGDLRYKAWNAREHGAAAVIIVDAGAAPAAKGAEPPAEAPLPRLAVDGTGGDAGLPVVVVTRAAAGALLKGKHKARVVVALEKQKASAFNVVGKIQADAEDKIPGVVVIGAHYDHLGLGGHGSLAPDSNLPHNGADDNASGTAALLEVARELQARRGELRRDVWIVAFSAEESGVLGSAALVKNPPPGLVIGEVMAMLNMDMVGRLRGNKLSILGGESAEEWKEIMPALCAARRIGCSLGGDGYGPSDHMPFFAAGVPVLHFFSGAHSEYHKPADDVELINAAGLAQVALLVADAALAVGAREQKLTLRAAPPQTPAGDMRSFGASLGTVPDYAGPPEGKSGVLLQGVRPGSPAEKAGLQRGDLLVKIGKHEIKSIEDFMFVLRSSKPGQTAKVVIERDGKLITLEVTFGASQRR